MLSFFGGGGGWDCGFRFVGLVGFRVLDFGRGFGAFRVLRLSFL